MVPVRLYLEENKKRNLYNILSNTLDVASMTEALLVIAIILDLNFKYTVLIFSVLY